MLAYYRSFILRLIHAGELPADVIAKFDDAVGSEFWKSLKAS